MCALIQNPNKGEALTIDEVMYEMTLLYGTGSGNLTFGPGWWLSAEKRSEKPFRPPTKLQRYAELTKIKTKSDRKPLRKVEALCG